MSTPRWQMREFEQQKLIEVLFDAVTDQIDDEDEKWDDVIYDCATVQLKLLRDVRGITRTLKESPQDEHAFLRVARSLCHFGMENARPTLRDRTVMVVATIARFSCTEEEAEMLAWRFFQKLCESLGNRFTRDHLAQAVHHPETVYGGPTMDDVLDPEADERLTAIENAEAWVVRPI